MEQFLIHDTLDLIGVSLVLGTIGWVALQALASYLERDDRQWCADNPVESPLLHYEVDPTNLDQILALQGVNERDRADIIKGSKLS